MAERETDSGAGKNDYFLPVKIKSFFPRDPYSTRNCFCPERSEGQKSSEGCMDPKGKMTYFYQ